MGEGPNGNGQIFRTTPAGLFSSIYVFSSSFSGGDNPPAGLLAAPDGNLYGVTHMAGQGNGGTVYKLTIPPANFSLATSNLLEGPNAAIDSVTVAASSPLATWSASVNSGWLHLAQANGTGSTNVIFSFDQNPGATRTGTLTIAGQTLTVTQAGATYVQAPAPLTTIVSNGLSYPFGLAVDAAGNVYIPDYGNNAVKKWSPANNTVTFVVSNGLSAPSGIAVDAAGNVYISDASAIDSTVKEWLVASNTLITVVSNGLYYPEALALDGAGNIYIADSYNHQIKEWVAASNGVMPLVTSGLQYPYGVSVDVAGNVYIADSYDNLIKEWNPLNPMNNTATTVPTISGLNHPVGIKVDGSGNLYFTDSLNNTVGRWSAISHSVTPLASGLNNPTDVTVDANGNVFICDSHNNAIEELPRAFVDPTPKVEPLTSGSDTLPMVLPSSENLLAPFNPTSDSPWLTINGVTNGVVSFSFTAGTNRVAHITLLGHSIPVIQPGYVLGTTNLVEGPTAGYDSVVLAVTSVATWTATANASWLHLSAANQSGSGSTNVIFSFDQNTNATRSGTLTVGGQTLTVTQAGATYVQAPGPVTGLITSGLNYPMGVALDTAGNVYVAQIGNNTIAKWTKSNNTVSTAVSDSFGLHAPFGVAVDTAGNIYIADNNNQAIKEWVASSNTITNLVSTGLYYPAAVVLDSGGNVYFADSHNNAIKEWIAASGTVTNLVTSGLYFPSGVAVDVAGNVYIADTYDNAIKEWNPLNNAVTTLPISGLNQPGGLAVDGSGNVYIADTLNNAIKKWSVVNGAVTTLASSGLSEPGDVVVDAAGNVYFSNTGNNIVQELPRAFVDPTAKIEPLATGGSDTLPVVIPAKINLAAPFTPTSDSPWLTITGVTNGVVSFSFTAGTNRVGHINLLGQSIPVIQPTYVLGTTNLVEGPSAGYDSVMLAATSVAPWTITSNASWLRALYFVGSGSGSQNVIFYFDANPGATRTGAFTIAGQTLTVTQAGETYVQAPTPATSLVPTGLLYPYGTAVDAAGNVYISDSGNNSIKKWSPSNNAVTMVVSTNLSSPAGLALDGAGNIYIADVGNNAIKEWIVTSNMLITVKSGLNNPEGVAVDSQGVVYIADTYNTQVERFNPADGSFSLVAGNTVVNHPYGVAVDVIGNVYIADTYNNRILSWSAANSNLTFLVTTPANPCGVAVDGSGNVYYTALGNNSVNKRVALTGAILTLVSSNLNAPLGISVDSSGNVYFGDQFNNAVKELPRAFVDPTPKIEPFGAGSDTLPPVVPTTANLLPPFNPTSDQPWLTVNGSSGGVVNFSFTLANTNRTGHLTVLGQSIAVSQVINTYNAAVTNGQFVFGFTNYIPNASYNVLSATNLTTPLANWVEVDAAFNLPTGYYQFTIPDPATNRQQFYRLHLIQ